MVGRPRLIQAVAFVAASHPAGAIGGRSGQHDPGVGFSERRTDSASSFLLPCIRFLLCRCGVASIHEIRGASSPHNQGDPSPWCVSRETHHAKGAVLRYLPRSSSFAARPAPHLCKPGYLAARIRICGDFTGFNLYIDITLYLVNRREKASDKPVRSSTGVLGQNRASPGPPPRRDRTKPSSGGRPPGTGTPGPVLKVMSGHEVSATRPVHPAQHALAQSTWIREHRSSLSGFPGVHGCGRVSRGTPGENHRP